MSLTYLLTYLLRLPQKLNKVQTEALDNVWLIQHEKKL
jgi:hypothetical protein